MCYDHTYISRVTSSLFRVWLCSENKTALMEYTRFSGGSNNVDILVLFIHDNILDDISVYIQNDIRMFAVA